MRFVVATAGGDRATYNCTVVLFASVGFGGLAGCALGRFIGVFIYGSAASIHGALSDTKLGLLSTKADMRRPAAASDDVGIASYCECIYLPAM